MSGGGFARTAGAGIALGISTWLVGGLSAGAPTGFSRRVVFVSFDGVGGLEESRQESTGLFGPDGFRRAAREGFSAERLLVVTPSLTAVSHSAISAGAPPAITGIVGNTYHPARAPLRERISGFTTESDVEMLWEAAARQGKRVASLTWPGLAQETPRTSTAVGIRYVESKQHGVKWRPEKGFLTDARIALPLGIVSFSPPKSIPLPADAGFDEIAPVTLVAIDTTDDGRRNYDEVVMIGAHGELRSRVRSGGWFSLSKRRDEHQGDRNVLFGQWGKVIALPPDLSGVSLYLAPVSRTYASPEDFRQTLDRRAGFWPGPPDSLLLEGAEPDTATFVEQAVRFSQFFVEAFEVANRRGDWDLLFAYQPLVDEAEHFLLLTEPKQKGYTPQRARQFAAAMREVWKAADRAMAAYLRFTRRGDLFVVSDHGMRATVRSFSVSEALRAKGWLKTEILSDGVVQVAADSSVDVSASGGTALVTINRSGVLPGGVVSAERASALIREMAVYFSSLTDDENLPVFSVVAPPGQTASLGLDHANAGDLILIARGRTSLRSTIAPAGAPVSPFGPAEFPGQHGFDPDPELDGIFFHLGEGVRPERVKAFRAVDVARRVAERLGISPPDGRR